MIKAKRILLVGSEAFAVRAAALLDPCDDVETVHVSRVTIELFVVKWRPECAVINCDDLEHDPLVDIEALSRFRPKVTIVLVSSKRVSQAAASAVSGILLPAEMPAMLAPILSSLCNESLTVNRG